MARHGEPVVIRLRPAVGTGRPQIDVEVRARVTGYTPQQLVGGIVQGDRKIIILVEDLTAKQVRLARVTVGQWIMVRGTELSIMAMDDSTHRDGTELIAIELNARG